VSSTDTTHLFSRWDRTFCGTIIEYGNDGRATDGPASCLRCNMPAILPMVDNGHCTGLRSPINAASLGSLIQWLPAPDAGARCIDAKSVIPRQ